MLTSEARTELWQHMCRVQRAISDLGCSVFESARIEGCSRTSPWHEPRRSLQMHGDEVHRTGSGRGQGTDRVHGQFSHSRSCRCDLVKLMGPAAPEHIPNAVKEQVRRCGSPASTPRYQRRPRRRRRALLANPRSTGKRTAAHVGYGGIGSVGESTIIRGSRSTDGVTAQRKSSLGRLWGPGRSPVRPGNPDHAFHYRCAGLRAMPRPLVPQGSTEPAD